MFPDELKRYKDSEEWDVTNEEEMGLDEEDCQVSVTQCCRNQCCGNQCCGNCCTGPMGPRGPRGPMGYPGPRGFQGPMGMPGPMGPQGPQGAGLETVVPFVEGTPYRAGTMVFYNGSLYQVAKDNPSGIPGISPDYLLVTAAGPTGPQGPAGATGAVGPQGPIGPQGPAGAAGAVGPTGPQGPAGATGATGPCGCAKQNGGRKNPVSLPKAK